MASGELYQLIDRQSYFGELVLNVYYYTQTAGTSGAQALAEAWIADIGSVIRTIQVDTVTHTRVDVVNLDDPTDYVEFTWSANNTGLRSGVGNPSFMAWGFRLNRVSRLARHGQKRIAGCAEGDILGNEADPGVVTALGAVAAALSAEASEAGGDGVWSPRIVKKTGTPPNVVYTPYPIASGQYIRVTTQTSRRMGRGA